MILNDGTYPAIGSLPFFRPPLYPLFIAATWLFFPESSVAIKAAQVLMHAGTCWLICRVAVLIFDSEFRGFAAGLLFALNPLFLFHAAAIQTETLHTLLIVLALYQGVKGLKLGGLGLRDSVLTGLSLGLAALCKPSALAVGLVVLAAVWLMTRPGKGSLKLLGSGVAAMFIVILPWSAYNWHSRGEFILINDASGFNLWLGNDAATLKLLEGDFADKAEAQAFAEYVESIRWREQLSEFEAENGYSTLSLKERERLWSAKAVSVMRSDPGMTARLFGWKLYAFWKPFLSPIAYSARTTLASAMVLVPLFLAGFIGFAAAALRTETRGFAVLFAIFAVTVTGIHVIIVSQLRLRVPYIDPVVTIFAAGGVGMLLERSKMLQRFEKVFLRERELAAE
jgi:4-amino-4-deoxy-L-arabinose transferase-like glycosyltransferase